MKVIIIGGVAGGATAAARLRRLDESAEIVIYERSGYISYANCGLPYYIGGEIEDRAELTLQTPQSFFARFNIVAKVNHEVTAIDTSAKRVTVKDLKSGAVFTDGYDKLIIATGAKPALFGIGGAHLKGVFTLRTVEDTLAIRDYIDGNGPRTAVIAGGGYIGIELAENLVRAGLKVTILQRPDQLLAPLDYDMACLVSSKLRREGVEVRFGASVQSFSRDEEWLKCNLADGTAVACDIAVAALGVLPDSALAQNAGLKTGIKGAICVNERMQTSAPDVYAVGDAVEITHFVTGKKSLISLAGPANKQGRIAADNICGIPTTFGGSQGSSVIKVFDMTVATTGINQKTAQSLGLDCEAVVLSPSSHAGYYPGARTMTMKVLFERSTYKLLGAQIVGYDGVDKRIDVLATAMRAGLKAYELTELDLAYAPPYSSAKDPVNMAGYMIENMKNGLVKQFSYADIAGLTADDGAFLLDARTPAEYAAGHAKGFVNIPLDDLRSRIGEVPKAKRVYVMCHSGLRSYLACRILAQNGYTCYNFSGGYAFLRAVASGGGMPSEMFACGMEK